MLNHKLMEDNITAEDRDALISFLQSDPILTNNKEVRKFEKEWSNWLGVKHSVFVNSGSSANLLSMSVIKFLFGEGEIIVPPLTWVSDIASVLQCGHKPVFVDIDLKNLAMNEEKILSSITDKTKAVFLTHILGYNGLSQRLIEELEKRNIPLIEDVCESHGATLNGKKLGSFGLMSNFSFYYAHHMSTIEGGMISTNDDKVYEVLRMMRSHGMVRESDSEDLKNEFYNKYPDLNRDFIFAYPAYNVRSTEINAIIGLNQLKRLDQNNIVRTKNNEVFLKTLNSEIFFTDFDQVGSVNYAFVLLLKEANHDFANFLMEKMNSVGIDFRRGTSGGGNQLRQPYLKEHFADDFYKNFPNTDHVHFFGFYIGNYPTLDESKVVEIASFLNKCAEEYFKN